ncbi:MAG: peptidylprolyl isomerase [Phycisphaerales bacterium]
MKTRTNPSIHDGFALEQLESREMLTIVVNNPFSDVTVNRGSTASLVSLSNHFLDDWVTSVVRFATNSGNLDIALFGGVAANTVANFLNYVNTGAYNNTIFHREQELLANGIGILQGGGFSVPQNDYAAPFPAEADQSPQPIATNAAINLEHPTGNIRGSIAMARTNQINTATSQFFFNTVNNTSILDDPTPNTPDAGYSVFGQLTTASLAILDALTAYQNSDMGPDFNTGSGGNGGSFANLPLRKAPTQHQDGLYVDPPIARSDFLQITSASVLSNTNIDAVPNGIYRSIEVVSSDNSIATASVVGGNLVITPSTTNVGTAMITVRITGLDGTLVTSAFDYTVQNAVPTAGGMQGQSNVAVGGSMLLSTYGVRDPDSTSPVSSVAFYHDTNGNGTLDDADTLMATDTSATGGWNARVDTTGLSAGANRFFAVTTDVDGGTTTVSRVITLRPAVPGSGVTPGTVTVGSGVDVNLGFDGDLPNASGLRRIAMFIDTDGDGQLNAATDRLLGYATYSNGSWAYTVGSSNLAAGTNTVFARVTDNYGNLGGISSSVITVAD